MTAALSPLAHDPRELAAARQALREVFGHKEFRPGQPEVIAAVLHGRDVLAVMPTGGGKSVCYQIPALLADGGVTVVVSPLLSLMKDQVDALRANGVEVAQINSTIPREEQTQVLQDAIAGRLKMLYVAPERFGDGGFMTALRSCQVNLLAIDEAHCISQWGHDFRPAYRDLGGVRARLNNPPIIALTATADPLVRDDIVARLGLREPEIQVSGFDRPNLHFDVVRVKSQKEKHELIAEKLKSLGQESAIVYCGTKKKVEEVTDYLQRQRIKCARYHAGMDPDERKRIQDAFARDTLRIIVATNAFGMGIDKPDVRMVLHHDMPGEIESYYQEAGRAGRDGEPAECTLFFAPRDRSLREFFIELSHPEPHTVLDVYRALTGAPNGRAHVRELMTSDDEPGINAAIQALQESGLAERRGQMVFITGRGTEDDIDLAGLEAHRAHTFAKLDAMQRYAESRTCLRARILDYFGDTGFSPACGNCGPCMAPVAKHAAAPEPGEARYDEETVFHALRQVRMRFAEETNVPPYVIFADATLREMAHKLPRTKAEMLAVGGVGQVKYDKYGEAFLSVTKAATAPKLPAGSANPPTTRIRGPLPEVAMRSRDGRTIPDSVRRTWELLRSGLDIAEVAAERGYSVSTISNHMATLIDHREIEEITQWVDDATLMRIRKAVGDGPMGALGPIKEALGDEVSYEQLHLARAIINRI